MVCLVGFSAWQDGRGATYLPAQVHPFGFRFVSGNGADPTSAEAKYAALLGDKSQAAANDAGLPDFAATQIPYQQWTPYVGDELSHSVSPVSRRTADANLFSEGLHEKERRRSGARQKGKDHVNKAITAVLEAWAAVQKSRPTLRPHLTGSSNGVRHDLATALDELGPG
jgi:hypothetical protein